MSARSAIDPAALHDDAFCRDPFPVWERLRHEAPLFHDTIDDVYVLTRYDDVASVLRDDATYSTWIYKTWFGDVMGDTFAQHDGERHTRERARIAPHLVGAPLDRLLRPTVEAVSVEVVRELPKGNIDLIGPFTFRLPGLVMASLFTIPASERARFLELAGAISLGLVGGEDELAAGRAARSELEKWTTLRLAERRSDGGPDDLLEWLRGPDATGAVLDDDYICTNVNFLAAAGSSTVDYALRNVLWVLLAHPDLAAAAGEGNVELLDRAVTEAFRFAPPVPYEGRITTEDVEWYDRTIPRGSIVRVALASATNDEAVFADPRRFDPARSDVWAGDSRGGIRRDRSASHLAFGLGSHFCAGYKLSRLEAREGLTRLFRDRRPRLAEPLPPLRIHQHHLTIPCLRVTLAQGG
ncbi:cytochrome P450 [Gaiella sp.]|uniref:cytochrome P450 n=1 Tax=Gaiella sp. TaxID=2663207 RepID=UPI003262FB05